MAAFASTKRRVAMGVSVVVAEVRGLCAIKAFSFSFCIAVKFCATEASLTGCATMSVHVFHAAHLADGQGFARGLQFFLALVVVFARFKALGR